MPGRFLFSFPAQARASATASPRASFVAAAAAAAIAAALLPGCQTLPCPTIANRAFEIIIGNGAYEDECLYSLEFDFGEETHRRADCSPSGTDCVCAGGEEPGTYALRLMTATPKYELASKTVSAEDSSCGVVTQQLHWDREPPEALALPSCVVADEKLRACELGDPPPRDCIVQGLRLSASYFDDEARAEMDCWFGCTSTPSCEDLEHSMCAPQADLTDYERCLGACLGMDAATILEYAPYFDGNLYCPGAVGDGAGGAGGASP